MPPGYVGRVASLGIPLCAPRWVCTPPTVHHGGYVRLSGTMVGICLSVHWWVYASRYTGGYP